jgi:Reverse transcriptase (RNA-dependent DNA polymerase)
MNEPATRPFLVCIHDATPAYARETRLMLRDLAKKVPARILNAIYEPIFLPCSWAYRLGRNAREAVRTLKQELQFGCYGYVVEIDIRGFFDRIDHNELLKMLELRIDDRPLLRERSEGSGWREGDASGAVGCDPLRQ